MSLNYILHFLLLLWKKGKKSGKWYKMLINSVIEV